MSLRFKIWSTCAVRILVCLLVNCFWMVKALAVEEPYVNELKGSQVAANNFFTVSDEKFNNSTSWNLIRQNLTSDNIVTFEINFDTTVFFYNTPFDCTVNFKIYIYGNQSDTSQITDSTTHSSISLTVHYDTLAGKPYKGIAMYKFIGAYKYKVKILSVSSAQLGSTPVIFRLKGQIIVNRQYKFQDNSTDVTRFSKINGNQLKLEWTPSSYPGAEMFDLEYTFIDSSSQIASSIRTYNTGGYYYVPADSLSKWFRNNNTRITTATSGYLINVAIDSGYVLFRLRGVQDSLGVRIEGNWNYDAKPGSSFSCPGSCPKGIIFFAGHEISLNWQYAVVFAEEGKRKEVISYFDGTLRNRQSVTLTNTDNKNIVQETIYDALGRPALNLLPAPTLDSTIHYFKGFNLNSGGSVPYSFSDLQFRTCMTLADSASYASGAGAYYSTGNPFQSAYYNAKYIPNAGGFPFTVTEYMADNTGRIKAQGGVGPSFQLGSNHETRYFYGKPTQTELDRLFGLEAGSASHYLKNMVMDPNGQISVSYMDASGKTIATALAGGTPANMHELPSSSGASVNVSNDIILPGDFTGNPGDNSMTASATFLAPVTGTYVFDYKIDSLTYRKLYGTNKDSCICSNCYYDLEILVKDDCENILRRDTIAAGNVFDTTCSSPPSSIKDSIHVSISKIGEYYVTFNLRVSRDAMDYYDSVHLVKNTDIKKLNYFLLEELKQTDFYGCYNNCKTCFDKLGTKAEFTTKFKSLYTSGSVSFLSADSLWVDDLYDSLYANCQTIQSGCSYNVCDEKLSILKRDVSPGGQYALFDSSYTLLETPINAISRRSALQWFPDEFGNRDSVILVDHNGDDSVKVDVKQLSDSNFIKYWKDSWADSLVKLHPEYCFYLWCTVNSGSYEFDRTIEDWMDSDTAIARGWFSPSVYDTILAHDPFFLYGGNGYSLRNKMRDSLRYFSRTMVGYSQTDRNILNFIDLILYCKRQTGCHVWEGCKPDSACRSRSREWFFYKEFYLNLKQQFYERARRTSTDTLFANCKNCFIGKDILGYQPFSCVDTCYNNTFAKSYGGSNEDIAYDAKTTSSGGIIVAGKTNSFGSGGYDAYIIKVNNQGDVQWSKVIGGSHDDEFRRVKQVSSGGFIAIGTTKSYLPSGHVSDILVTRLYANGSIAWTKRYGLGSAGGEVGRDICETNDGGFALCAETNYDTGRVLLAKLNSAGSVSWSKKYESSAAAEAMDILADADTIVISGHYHSASHYNDGFLLKANHNNGNVTWVRGYDIAGYNNYVSEIYKLNGQYYFKSISTPSLSNLNDTAFTVLSTNLSGTIQIKRDINTSAPQVGSIYPDKSGNILIGQSDAVFSTDILYYLKMNSSGSFVSKYQFPKVDGYASIQKTVQAPGNTSVLAGYINPDPGYDDNDIFILKTSADTSNIFGCGFNTPSVTTSQPTVTTDTLSWSTSSVSISLTDSTISASNPSTVTDTLCSYLECSALNCDTTTYTGFSDTSCVRYCAGGVYNPYDRDSISFHIEYGNPAILPSSVPAGYGNCRFYPSFTLHTGDTAFCKFLNVWVCRYDSTCPSGGICGDTAYASQCTGSPYDSLYKNKVRRYPEYVNTADYLAQLQAQNPKQTSGDNEAEILAECHATCDAQADIWMNILRRCNNMSSGDSTALRAALVDICSKGCSINNPFGTSSIPNSISATYHSFEEAITAIIGSPAPDDSCTQELMAMPYPYNKQPAYTDQLISETDSAICAKINSYKTTWQGSGYSGSFHSWLKIQLGHSYQLDSLELDDLLNSCTNCNYLLKNDIILPVPFMTGAPPCLNCDSVQAALTAFNTKFPSIDTLNDDYETLFTNFFNHRFGYSLTYYQYKDFLDSCDAHGGSYTVKLCDEPMQQDITTDQSFVCTAELFAGALTGAYNVYVVYIDSVRRDFQEAWMTKCMNAQPKLTMTADLYEYHYTLYYYDQSGNLVKTVPPEGVQLLDNTSIAQVQAFRTGSNPYCSNNNAMVFTNGSVNFPGGTNAPQVSVGSGNFTIECWIKLNSYSDQGIISNNHYVPSFFFPHDYGYALDLYGGKLNLAMSEAAAGDKVEAESPSISSFIALNSWTHIAVERRGISTVKMFINGNQVPVTNTINSPNNGDLDHGDTDPLYVGASLRYNTLTKLSSGKLRHVRIYTRALPATEIRQNFNDYCGNPSNHNALVFWETFTEGVFTASGGNDYVYDRIYTAAGQKSGTIAFETTGTNTLVPEHRLVTTYQYNSLNQVLQQYSPDGDTSVFFYDKLGRLTASQNKEQKDNASYSGSSGRFSYTKYDSLGRITEVGEKSTSTDIRTINMLKPDSVTYWLGTGTNRQLTKTIYDDPVNINLQDYNSSRKRVVASIYLENSGDGEGDSTLYSYDILGNVKTLLQHVKALVAVDNTNGRKRIDYNYDLVSGKVNMVSYQYGKGDQFFYKYSYDADNRVIRSYSSRDKMLWIEDASYNYYLHGPLARTELGHYKVQGIDYVYTLQGWLKGINSDSLSYLYDMANDGKQGATFGRVSRDVYGFKLGYYNSDYTAIGGSSADAFSKKAYTAPGSLEATGNQLFNGNISYTTLALSKINSAVTAGYSYGYDQLNRLTEMRQHTTGATGGWSNSDVITAYRESITYDANGNILKYLRKGNATTPHMDSLTYKYAYSGGNLVNNKLNHVNDSIPSGNYSIDIDNQSADNYVYDKIGNLKKDVAENIDTIRWTVYGKINRIVKSSGATLIDYKYDPGGNRTSKKVTVSGDTTTTFYIRDAQGNVMGIYSKKNSVAIHWDEQHLYGSSRLGMWNWDTIVPSAAPVVVTDPIYDSLMLGSRTYELTNHLGNVLSTISDKKIGNDSSGTVNYYIAEVLSQQDYYPFGMTEPGRSYNAGNQYRYGFNGQEKSNEIKGEGNSYTAEFWEYDSRLGRRWNVDPKPNVSISFYNCFAGNPIVNIDLLGDTTFVTATKDGKYNVIGGNLAGNNNGIYIKDSNGKLGDLVGYSATPESFYNSESRKWMGTIDPKDQSGRKFLNDEIIIGDPGLVYYMKNATGGEKYDFKRNNAKDDKDPKYSDPNNFYRGMPILDTKDGKDIYASARDIGNIAAGWIAGKNGIGWGWARIAFDALESYQKGEFKKESTSTKYGQKLGWRIAYAIWYNSVYLRQIPGQSNAPGIKVSKDVITKNELNGYEF